MFHLVVFLFGPFLMFNYCFVCFKRNLTYMLMMSARRRRQQPSRPGRIRDDTGTSVVVFFFFLRVCCCDLTCCLSGSACRWTTWSGTCAVWSAPCAGRRYVSTAAATSRTRRSSAKWIISGRVSLAGRARAHGHIHTHAPATLLLLLCVPAMRVSPHACLKARFQKVYIKKRKMCN